MTRKTIFLTLIFSSSLLWASTSRTPTHPVFLWGKTILESKDKKERKLAAFKLSQYSQPIYQEIVIEALLKCVRDPNLEIKVLCTKAIGRVRKKNHLYKIREALLGQFRNQPALKKIIINSLIELKAVDPPLYQALFAEAKRTTDPDELIILMSYFQEFGLGEDGYVNDLIALYKKFPQVRVRVAILKALGESANGQSVAIGFLSDCAKNAANTALQVTCLSGLKTQGIRDKRSWQAIEAALESNDAEVLEATLDLLDTLPATKSERLSKKLVLILKDAKMPEIAEKAVLALGVCGDYSEKTVEALTALLEDKSADENVRIAAALVLGKQAKNHISQSRKALLSCRNSNSARGIRTACQLGINDLNHYSKQKNAQN